MQRAFVITLEIPYVMPLDLVQSELFEILAYEYGEDLISVNPWDSPSTSTALPSPG